MAEQATNVLVPTGGAGGLALGAWALRRGGMSTEHIARRSFAFFVITSAPNFLCVLGLRPLLAIHLLSGHALLWPLVFGYVVGQLGGLIPLPGGVGGTGGGLIGAMVLYGASLSRAAAAVVIYRTVQLGIPAILGAIAFVQLRRTLRDSPEPGRMCGALAEQ